MLNLFNHSLTNLLTLSWFIWCSKAVIWDDNRLDVLDSMVTRRNKKYLKYHVELNLHEQDVWLSVWLNEPDEHFFVNQLLLLFIIYTLIFKTFQIWIWFYTILYIKTINQLTPDSLLLLSNLYQNYYLPYNYMYLFFKIKKSRIRFISTSSMIFLQLSCSSLYN